MPSNRLRLNAHKLQFVWLSTRQELHDQARHCSLLLRWCVTTGCSWTQSSSPSLIIDQVCRSCYYQWGSWASLLVPWLLKLLSPSSIHLCLAVLTISVPSSLVSSVYWWGGWDWSTGLRCDSLYGRFTMKKHIRVSQYARKVFNAGSRNVGLGGTKLGPEECFWEGLSCLDTFRRTRENLLIIIIFFDRSAVFFSLTSINVYNV